MSIQDLQQNPQDTSNFYLANIYQATINPNESSSLPTSPPPFTPPNYAVWVNALWFLSLVISITCALLATLLQQWARRYLKVTQPRYSPHKRARIRSFFAEGVDKFLLPWAVEALPTMLHLSLFLFFAGLAVFLWNVDLTIFKLVLSWIGFCAALYGCITFIPIFRHDSPYYTPLSLPVWHFVTGISFLTCRALQRITCSRFFSYGTYRRFRSLTEGYRKLLVQGMQKIAEETAFNLPPEIDTRAFQWTFDSLDEDHELERFFSGLPGLRSSKVVKDPLPDLTSEQQEKLLNALMGLLDRTSSSNLLSEQVKIRRTVICGKAIGPADIPQIQRVLRRIYSQVQEGPVQSAEIAHLVRGWDDGKDQYTTTIIQAIVSTVVARAQRHDDLWFSTAADAMGIPESVLRNHAMHGNSLSLAIFIHIVRQQFSVYWERNGPWEEFSRVLEATSKFNVLDTSPELQHEFCALWNQVVRAADDGPMPWYILRPIRNIYLTLHLHTDCAPTQFSAATSDIDRILLQVSTYPLCNMPNHHPDSIPLVLHENAVPVPASLPGTLHIPSPSILAPVHIEETTLDVPLLDDDILVPVSSRPVHHPAADNLSDLTISPDPLAATGEILDLDTSSTKPAEISTSTTSVPPTGGLSLEENADLLMHSDAPEILSPSLHEPGLENVVPRGKLPTLSFPRLILTDRLYRSSFIDNGQTISGHVYMADLR